MGKREITFGDQLLGTTLFIELVRIQRGRGIGSL